MGFKEVVGRCLVVESLLKSIKVSREEHFTADDVRRVALCFVHCHHPTHPSACTPASKIHTHTHTHTHMSPYSPPPPTHTHTHTHTPPPPPPPPLPPCTAASSFNTTFASFATNASTPLLHFSMHAQQILLLLSKIFDFLLPNLTHKNADVRAASCTAATALFSQLSHAQRSDFHQRIPQDSHAYTALSTH
jgi:hypothetical protein